MANFNRYCVTATGTAYKVQTVQQALRKELVARNLIMSVKRGVYMLNPMIGGCNTFQLRKTLIADYSYILVTKGKDGSAG